MNKEQYKRLLNLRQSEEAMFQALIRLGAQNNATPREIINALPINHKRAWYILEKWNDWGIYNYGVSLDLGWIEENK